MMKRRVFGMLLSLCLVLALIPAAAFAEDAVQTISLKAPYTTTVKLGGSVEPGKTVFDLAIVDAKESEESYADVTYSGSVTTNGKGSYSSSMTFTGPFEQLWIMLCEGAIVKQIDGGEEGWTYADEAWGLVLENIPVAMSLDDAAPEIDPNAYKLIIYPVICNGTQYEIDWEAKPLEKMTFTNTYTKSASEPTNPDETSPDADVSALPKTGDSSNLTGWLILLAVSAVAVAGAVVYSRRRKNARE